MKMQLYKFEYYFILIQLLKDGVGRDENPLKFYSVGTKLLFIVCKKLGTKSLVMNTYLGKNLKFYLAF